MTLAQYAGPQQPTNGLAVQGQYAPAIGYGQQGLAQQVERPADVDSWTMVLASVAQLAEQICNTDFVPAAMRNNPAACTAAILTGRELGIGPMTSLAHIHIVKGKPGQSAQLMRQLVLAAGHQIRYVETTDSRCIVEGRRRGEDQWERVGFTAQQAKTAGITLGGYPEDKLVARATSRLCRRKFSDCIGGMPYTVEELEDGGIRDDTPTATDLKGMAKGDRFYREASDAPVEDTPAPVKRTAQRRTATKPAPTRTAPAAAAEPESAGPPLPGEDGYDEPAAESAPAAEAPAEATSDRMSQPQQRKLFALIREHDIEDRNDWASGLLGRDVTSFGQLTQGDASKLIDSLDSAGNADEAAWAADVTGE
jgi:hypothetical protein